MFFQIMALQWPLVGMTARAQVTAPQCSPVPSFSFNDPWATFPEVGSGRLQTNTVNTHTVFGGLPWAWLNNVISIHTPPTLPALPQTLCLFVVFLVFIHIVSGKSMPMVQDSKYTKWYTILIKPSKPPGHPVDFPGDKLSHQLLASHSKKQKHTEMWK